MYTLGTHPSTSFRSIFWPFTVGSSSIPSLCCCSDFAINTQLETISCLTNLEVKEWIQWYFLHISGSVCNWRFYDTGCTCIQWFHSHVFTNFMPVGWKANCAIASSGFTSVHLSEGSSTVSWFLVPEAHNNQYTFLLIEHVAIHENSWWLWPKFVKKIWWPEIFTVRSHVSFEGRPQSRLGCLSRQM